MDKREVEHAITNLIRQQLTREIRGVFPKKGVQVEQDYSAMVFLEKITGRQFDQLFARFHVKINMGYIKDPEEYFIVLHLSPRKEYLASLHDALYPVVNDLLRLRSAIPTPGVPPSS